MSNIIKLLCYNSTLSENCNLKGNSEIFSRQWFEVDPKYVRIAHHAGLMLLPASYFRKLQRRYGHVTIEAQLRYFVQLDILTPILDQNGDILFILKRPSTYDADEVMRALIYSDWLHGQVNHDWSEGEPDVWGTA